MKQYTQEDVDKWCEENNKYSSYELFCEMLPKYEKKLDRLDKRIRDLLKEIREVFPDAIYYTASGGFNLLLGNSHADDMRASPQQQRIAWSGKARISDGDF